MKKIVAINCSSDALQVFNPKHKKQRHETMFPADKRKAFALGEQMVSNADAAYRIPFLPNFPVILKIWLPDEGFPASGRLLLDSSADHYLTIEDAVTVAEILLNKLGQEAFL